MVWLAARFAQRGVTDEALARAGYVACRVQWGLSRRSDGSREVVPVLVVLVLDGWDEPDVSARQ